MDFFFAAQKNPHNNRTRHTMVNSTEHFIAGPVNAQFIVRKSVFLLCLHRNSLVVLQFHSYYGVALRFGLGYFACGVSFAYIYKFV